MELETTTTATPAFTNREVDAEDLPDYRIVNLKPVAKGYLAWALVTQTSFWLILAAGLWVLPFLPFVTIDWAWWNAMPAASLLVAGLTTLYFFLDARVRSWALREHDLVYRYGLFWRKTVILPFARIQHVEALQGPVERRMDLMRLKCFTAGGYSGDLLVRGLDSASATRIRGFLLEQIAEAPEAPGDGVPGGPDGED